MGEIFDNKLGRLTQGVGYRVKGVNAVYPFSHEKHQQKI